MEAPSMFSPARHGPRTLRMRKLITIFDAATGEQLTAR
jgi:hypothetical protein